MRPFSMESKTLPLLQKLALGNGTDKFQFKQLIR